jgi:DNA (cytosine-5)-methyltransferase 1
MKPPYRVMSMEEVESLPWNGRTVISTFSGCGGSSLGYRMAGFKVMLANEFIPAARDIYRLNANPSTIIDPRDIREVTGESLLESTGLKQGELDILDGSPPCSAFSTAGKRHKGWGKIKSYSDSEQVVDDLFFEYSRLLRSIRPRVFIAENVSGLVKGVAKGYFLNILRDLRSCGYRVSCRVLDSLWLGVPQSRQRTIFVGVRDDLHLDPVHPAPLPYWYSVSEALEGLDPGDLSDTTISKGMSAYWDRTRQGHTFSEAYMLLNRTDKASMFNYRKLSPAKWCPTIMQSPTLFHWSEPRTMSIPEMKRLGGFPDDFRMNGSYAKRYERIGRAVPPVMMSHIARAVLEGVLCKT